MAGEIRNPYYCDWRQGSEVPIIDSFLVIESESIFMSLSSTDVPCEHERRVAAVCRGAEAARVQQIVADLPHPAQADLLWLTWVQWRALGREALCRQTGLSAWTVAGRLSRLRDMGAPVLSWSEETDMLARGRF